MKTKNADILRKIGIWAVVIVLVFLAGIIADHFLRYKPLSEKLAEAQTTLAQSDLKVEDLQAKVGTLNVDIQQADEKITVLETENETIQSELDLARIHLKLMQVLVDVNYARLALFLENVEDAQKALLPTSQLLDTLAPYIAEVDQDLAANMPQRLALIISGLNRDNIDAAKIDLELFIQDLLEIKIALFGD